MDGLLVFDHLNDIIFSKYNTKFVKHINDFAVGQCLQVEPNEDEIDGNILVQIFSPIIASHRIMSSQFGNSYTFIQCKEDLNVYFDQYMGYLFVAIHTEDISSIRRFLSISIAIVRYLCGPDVYQLKKHEYKKELACKLIDSWILLCKNDQAVLVEAIEQLVVNSDLSSTTLKALQESVENLSSHIEYTKIHALILVQNKFLSLYSSQNAKELSATDILFTMILCNAQLHSKEDDSILEGFWSYQIFLAGLDLNPKCLPYVMHIIAISEGVYLIYLIEVGNSLIASSLYETFRYLHTIQLVQSQRDKTILQPAFENLDLAIKHLNDSLKKNKLSTIENCHKQTVKKWDIIRKKYQEFFKTSSDEALLRAETLTLSLLENLNELLKLTSVDEAIINSTGKSILGSSQIVKEKLESYSEFFKAKSIKNFSLGSRDSLTINKYLEEFPGLVHFLYIDRTNHRVTTPTLDINFTKDNNVTIKKIWSMINFARQHLMEGNLALIWKDTTFTYSYFLWFEDNSGAPLKPIAAPYTSLPLPGIICEDFYQKLKEICFPKMSPNKIRCYEIFCVHLGLVTASCVLEQTRRLSATIWELRGHPSHPIDLL